MSGKQRTLFQTWGSRPQSARGRHSEPAKGNGGHCFAGIPSGLRLSAPPAFKAEQEEDDDDLLLVAVYEAEKTLAPTGHQASEKQSEVCSGEGPSQTAAETLPGFDLAAGSVWIYPTNMPIRDYQFNIAQSALLQNTLVCLPTGLGKTFIAAVVMYNFYRWYPSGKIVFMAPTKPLVAQQIEACYCVMGIPQEHMAEMTGTTQAINRKEIWQTRKVFFLTPQVMVNDLTRGACPAAHVKCLVIDEAHKALGNHAYCQVVRELSNYTNQFRILALSATPGSDAKAVQQVITNLLIAQIELRSEDSPDIQPYSHERQLEKFVVPLGDELVAIQKAYIQVLEAVAGRLIRNKLLSSKDIPNLTKYQIVLARDQFRKNPPTNIKGCEQGILEGDYALCISLFHGYELLLQMGSRSFYVFLRTIMDGTKGAARARSELSRNHDFVTLYQRLESMFAGSRVSEANGSLLFNSSLGPGQPPPFIYSHPKLKKLEEVVLKHFKSWKRSEGEGAPAKGPVDTRVMIFSSFRDSVQEIAEMLNQHLPVVKVMTFVGHSSTGNGVKGFTQKEQLEVMKRFRDGGYNTLVSTCVGEEGLDIGEVDLIVCFDAQKSPIRLVQRMGRTGRKRQGRIVVILTAGREERTYNQSQSIKRSIHKAILGNSMLHFNSHSPRMVPEGLHPAVHKMYITQASYETKDNTRQSSAHRKSVLFNGTMCKQSNPKDDWSLTTEEFEAWNTLYRIKDSDGIKEVTMPRTCFESFSDKEQKLECGTNDFRELSLSEWRLWQNQLLPTHLVNHSDRCNNFVSVMEMIEILKHEEWDSHHVAREDSSM
ncbi:Fanconi anemia group M protein isoform X2 [Pleurodeles waltl]|uniref:Fanconi anemia group M protein isoform X2 n=1 Tax=Pleurodeles waltl TaxID=8319 RepID=UPI0037098139